MKKLLATFVLAISAASAFATTVGVGYEYMGVASQVGKTQQEKQTVGLSQVTNYGTIDGAFTYDRTNGTQGNQNGYEIGYSYPVSVAGLSVTPRVVIGDVGTLAADGHFTGVGAEVKYPMFGLNTFAGAEYRLNAANAASNQKTYQVGADFAVTKAVSVRVALKHVNLSNVEFQNGAAATVKYSF